MREVVGSIPTATTIIPFDTSRPGQSHKQFAQNVLFYGFFAQELPPICFQDLPPGFIFRMIAQILDRLFQPLRYFASIKRGVIKAVCRMRSSTALESFTSPALVA